MHNLLIPVGTEITVFDPEDEPDSMPIYEGQVEGAFMSLEPGLYPFVVEFDEYFAAIEGLPHGMGPVDAVLVVSPAGESFAVTVGTPALDVIWSLTSD